MKTIIAGSRDIIDPSLVDGAVKASGFEVSEVVTGCARGVDLLGSQWAAEHRIPWKAFPANWDKYGKPAGLIRNCEMARYAQALIAVWDGKSKGTEHMIYEAKRLGLKVHVLTVSASPK